MTKRFSLFTVVLLVVAALIVPTLASAQLTDKPRAVSHEVTVAKGVDPTVDYASLTTIGPWDDRNYQLTAKDLALLAPNEKEQRDPVPAFFRVLMRKANPELRQKGPGQYPRSALQIFILNHGGYLIDGKVYPRAVLRDGKYRILLENGVTEEDYYQRVLTTNVRVTTPNGGAESAVKIHPLDANRVIAGSNGPGTGQIMHRSTNGGSTWAVSTALPLGGTCCDPTVDWSSNGNLAYAATLGAVSTAKYIAPAIVARFRAAARGEAADLLLVDGVPK